MRQLTKLLFNIDAIVLNETEIDLITMIKYIKSIKIRKNGLDKIKTGPDGTSD